MSKEAYVHNEVTLTCTNGFKTSKLLVKDRKVKIAGGKLIATEEDKPQNFMCKWAGVAAALLATLFITAPFLVAVLAAFVIGMIGAISLGSALCFCLLQGSTWTEFHPKVKIGGKRALVENSKLKCSFFSGDIKIFYDQASAEQELRNNQFRNTVEIFGAAFMWRTIGIAISNYGWLGGVSFLAKQVPLNLAFGYGIIEGANIITNTTTGGNLSDGIGDSIPFYGNNKKVWDVVQDDYQKPFTQPVDKTTESHISTNNKLQQNQNRFNEFEQNQTNQFKQDNPVHKYGRGKKSPHYGRQQQRQQKINSKARQHGANQRSRLTQRYQSRVQTTTQRNYTRANYGLLAFFAVSEVLAQHLEKTLANELQKTNSPENQARTATKVFAVNR